LITYVNKNDRLLVTQALGFDTSAYAVHRLPLSFIEYMKTVGSTRVMFGTNWPMLSLSQCLQQLDKLELSTEQRKGFFA